MNIGEIIQNIATGGAVLLGITYVVGGLIVNLNLTRRGVVEYQILKVKFLVVGIIFLLHFSGVVIFAFVLIVLLGSLALDPAVNVLFIRTLSIPSILSALALLYVWSRYSPDTRAPVGRWSFWFLLSSLATVFPLYVLLHQGFIPSRTLDWVANTVLAALSGLLTIIAAIYHYSAFYYGQPAGLGVLDPIGMGIPTRVDIVCDQSISADLVQLGLLLQKNILRDMYLIDETHDQYILSQERVPGSDGNNHTYKINKGLVKAILHKPDHMRKLSPSTNQPKKK
jgi:hypothetical protein